MLIVGVNGTRLPVRSYFAKTGIELMLEMCTDFFGLIIEKLAVEFPDEN